MPTSSQAMILLNNDISGQFPSRSSVNIKPLTSFGIVNLYEVRPLPFDVRKPQTSNVSLLGRPSEKFNNCMSHSTTRQNILGFDSTSKTFQWKVLDGKVVEDSRPASKYQTNRTAFLSRERPKTAGAALNRITVSMERNLETELVRLGFRPSAKDLRASYLELVHQNLHPCHSSAGHGISAHAKVGKNIAAVHEKPVKLKNILHRPSSDTSVHHTSKTVVLSSPLERDQEELPGDSDSAQEEEEIQRIKPSIYMCTHAPASRPRAAIFSLRDNEAQTHDEVKHLVEQQTGLKVKGLQYEPLPVRFSKPELRSRWIVEFCSAFEMDQAVRKGMLVGKDQIIMYKFDDIANREVKSFKYFKSIQDAKKRLKSAKSVGSHSSTRAPAHTKGTSPTHAKSESHHRAKRLKSKHS